MSEINEQFVLEDGRKAEKTVIEIKVNEKESQRVTEVKAEQVLPLKTQQRITEKLRSYVYERIIETLDQNTGSVIDTKVENFDCSTGELLQTASQANAKKLNSLGLLDEIKTVEETEKRYDIKNIVLTAIILAQIIGLAYLLFK